MDKFQATFGQITFEAYAQSQLALLNSQTEIVLKNAEIGALKKELARLQNIEEKWEQAHIELDAANRRIEELESRATFNAPEGG